MIGGIVSRIFLVAIIGGAIAGLFNTGIQQIAVMPMILEAETYETDGAAGHDHGDGAATEAHSHDHGEGAWSPSDGLERLFYIRDCERLDRCRLRSFADGGLCLEGRG